MIQCLLNRGFSQVSLLLPAKGAAAGSENQLLYLARLIPLHALKDCTVLAVNRSHRHPILSDHGHYDLAGCNQDFFARKGDVLLCPNRRKGWQEPDDSGDTHDDNVRLGKGGKFNERTHAGGKARPLRIGIECQILDSEFPGLGLQFRGVGTSGKADDLKSIWMGSNRVESLGADAPGRT